jgi:hypothetical protein
MTAAQAVIVVGGSLLLMTPVIALPGAASPRRSRTFIQAAAARAADTSHLGVTAPEGIRTPNLLIRRHGPMTRPGTIRVELSCR